jgi:hypothetical protein
VNQHATTVSSREFFNTIDPKRKVALPPLSAKAGLREPPRLSEPGRLCRPQRSAARLQAGIRRSIGGLHRQATDWLSEVRPGLEVVIRVFRSVYGS